MLELYREGTAFNPFIIGERRDGKFSLEISGDDMAVWLELELCLCGGRLVGPGDVILALGQAGGDLGMFLGGALNR